METFTIRDRWAVVAMHRPDKQVFEPSETKRGAIKNFRQATFEPWSFWYKAGFRAMKITIIITEQKDKK